MVWINNGDTGLSVRTKLNTIPNDGTNCLALSTAALGAGVQTLLGGAASGSGGPAGTTNPAFTTPNIGTPSAGTLTNCSGLPAAGVVGTALVVNGALGTPASGTLTNCTGLPAAGVVGTAAVLGANTFTAGQTITEAIGSSALTLTGAIQTTSQPVINATQTWNAGAITFTGIKLNVTNTASAGLSLLIDLQVGGVSQLNVTRQGLLSVNQGILANASYYIGFTGSSTIYNIGNGILALTNAAANNFTRLIFGAASSSASVPAIKRNATALNFRLGDDSADAPITCAGITMSGSPTFNGTNSTGAGSALLGTNCPAVTVTAPYTWVTGISSDGSTVFFPVWK